MHDGQGHSRGLGRELVAEHLGQQAMHDRVKALLTEAITILFGLPDIDVSQAAL